MKFLNRIQDRRELLIRLILVVVCAVQNTIVLTASLIERIDGIRRSSNYTLNIPAYVLGFLILFLLFAALTLPFKRPLIVAFFISAFINLIGLINYYECVFHGTVLTHQDIHNIGAAAKQMGNYSYTFTDPVKVMIICFALLAEALLFLRRVKVKYHGHVAMSALSLSVLVLLIHVFVFSHAKIVEYNGWSWEIQYSC